MKNVIYPEEAAKERIQGTVNLRFILDTTGTVKNAEITKSVHPLLDKEALRVVNAMPKWIPGKQNGKVVYVYYNLPIRFKLTE